MVALDIISNMQSRDGESVFNGNLVDGARLSTHILYKPSFLGVNNISTTHGLIFNEPLIQSSSTCLL